MWNFWRYNVGTFLQQWAYDEKEQDYDCIWICVLLSLVIFTTFCWTDALENEILPDNYTENWFYIVHESWKTPIAMHSLQFTVFNNCYSKTDGGCSVTTTTTTTNTSKVCLRVLCILVFRFPETMKPTPYRSLNCDK
jgi:Trk-type K+ transport system membrane component